MKKPVVLLSKRTQKLVNNYLQDQWPVLLITAPKGCGKSLLAKELANSMNSNSAQQIHMGHEGKSIGIDSVRELKRQSSLKPADKQTISVVVIHNVDNMTKEAQNAALKLLEEPNTWTKYILTVSNTGHLLPTLKSRSHELQITNPSIEQYQEYLADNASTKSDYFMTDGRLRFMLELAEDSNSELKNTIKLSKDYFKSSVYERLAMQNEIIDKIDFEMFLFGLQRITRYLLSSDSSNSKQKLARVYGLLSELSVSSGYASTNNKLALDYLAVNL